MSAPNTTNWIRAGLLGLPVAGALTLWSSLDPQPDPNVHYEAWSRFVATDHYEFFVDGRASKAGVGSLIYVQKGILHAHRNVGGSVGRMLAIHTLGALSRASSRRQTRRQTVRRRPSSSRTSVRRPEPAPSRPISA
jgi:hypothetical protein